MRIDIILDGNFEAVAAADIRELNDRLRRADIDSSLTVLSIPSIKDPLTIGIAVAGVAVATIGTVIGALSLWYSQRPKYSVTVQRGEVSYTIGNMSKGELETLRAKLEAVNPDVPLLIRLTSI